MTNALKKYRESNGLTQVEAAKLFDVSPRTIQRLERSTELPKLWNVLLTVLCKDETK